MMKRHLTFILIITIVICFIPTSSFAEIINHAHTWDYDNYQKKLIDNEYHAYIYHCKFCDAQKSKLYRHGEGESLGYKKNDMQTHYEVRYCNDCKSEFFIKKKHTSVEEGYNRYKPFDESTHEVYTVCALCGGVITDSEYSEHFFERIEGTPTYVDYNDTHHSIEAKCHYCDYPGKIFYEHNMDLYKIVKYATPDKNGTQIWKCEDCNREETRSVKWENNEAGCKAYDIKHSIVYYNSTSINVTLKNPLKGGVLKVKIGKKTYTKKLTTNSKSVKIKIKKPGKSGLKMSVGLYYGKRRVSYNFTLGGDRVYYAKKLRKGMTESQVKWTYQWGFPDYRRYMSNGRSYWYYDYIGVVHFKNKRVSSWSFW